MFAGKIGAPPRKDYQEDKEIDQKPNVTYPQVTSISHGKSSHLEHQVHAHQGIIEEKKVSSILAKPN